MRGASIPTAVLILGLASLGPVMAQKMRDNPKCQQWHSLIGDKTAEVEYRESPTGEWKKKGMKTEIEWILDGSFLQVKNHDSEGISTVTIYGYDPIQQTYIGSGFDNRGQRHTIISADWSGRTLRDISTRVSPDGRTILVNCTREYSADFTSNTVECQRFTDGIWWTDRKIKASKTK